MFSRVHLSHAVWIAIRLTGSLPISVIYFNIVREVNNPEDLCVCMYVWVCVNAISYPIGLILFCIISLALVFQKIYFHCYLNGDTSAKFATFPESLALINVCFFK